MRKYSSTLIACTIALVSASGARPPARVDVPEASYWPTAEWRRSTPEAQGFDSAKLADTLTAIRKRGIPIHSLQIVRNGYLVLDAYFYPYDGRALHDTASVTKSVTATLIGVAAGQRLLPTVKAPLLAQFPGRAIANQDERKASVTLEDLLTMRPGLACEARGEPTLREMRQHPDWTQFMLDQPMAHAPGELFVYCSPGMHVLSAVLTQATGGSALEFARRALFAPLGITQVEWPADPQGNSFGWGDLHLRPLDMAKLGFLYLHGGRWDGQQILPADWMQTATTVHSSNAFQNSYGYGWWVFTGKRAGQYEAVGRGGQRITVIPQENLIVVMTGGGFEPGDVGDLLAKALGPNKPLAENPAAVSRLASALRDATVPPSPRSAPAAPAAAARISGIRYEFAANDLGLRTAELQFPAASEGELIATFADGRLERHAIGLDGVPRMSAGRFTIPLALSGSWTSPETLQLSYDEVGNINMFQMNWHVADPQRVQVDVAERSENRKFTLTARAVVLRAR